MQRGEDVDQAKQNTATAKTHVHADKLDELRVCPVSCAWEERSDGRVRAVSLLVRVLSRLGLSVALLETYTVILMTVGTWRLMERAK